MLECAIHHVNEQRGHKLAEMEVGKIRSSIFKKRWTIKFLNKVSRRINFGEPLEAATALCDVISNEVVAVIGPSSLESSLNVRHISDQKQIPLIETCPDGSPNFVINLHPPLEDVVRAFWDVIDFYEWKEFTIVNQDDKWSIKSFNFLL